MISKGFTSNFQSILFLTEDYFYCLIFSKLSHLKVAMEVNKMAIVKEELKAQVHCPKY